MIHVPSKSFLHLLSLIALLVSLAGGAVTYTPARAAGPWFVKPAATGDASCSSWEDACTLQTALSLVAAPGEEIWVQRGTHLPHPTDRGFSFNLKNGVAILGGFAGTETQPNQRNPAANITILSGDLNGDDLPGFINNGENSLHVVRSQNNDSTAILDGVTITGGNANGSASPNSNGGGMLNESSRPTLTNVIFRRNAAVQGGGMLNDASSPTLTNVIFLENFAFLTETGNGGIGGGMAGWENSNPTLTNVTFARNVASFHGGGMANAGNSPILINVTFSGNSAPGGGGMFNSGSGAMLTNVTLSGNSASVEGGGLVNDGGSPTLINVTISGNSATQRGGGIFNRKTSLPTLINTIVANSPNGGDCINSQSALHPSSFNNLIEDASTACGLTNGVNGNITGVDPRLRPLANYGGRTRTHALQPGSPAIDTGANQICPQTDQRGVRRPWGSQCDIGAFELRTFRISGDANVARVKLHYENGALKTVTSDANGGYALTVPELWSGTVTPKHPCFLFSPPKRSYDNVRANQTAQNYAPSFDPASACAEIAVRIKTTGGGKFVLQPKTALRKRYATVNNGPVRLNGNAQSSVRFIASQRLIFPDSTNPAKYFELMALPRHLATTTYYFPAYDNKNFNARLRIVNLGNTTATVKVTVGQSLTKNYNLNANASVIDSYAGQNTGPLIVQSMNGTSIIASLSVKPLNNGIFSEMIGQPRLPQAQARSYLFPWFDNRSLNMQLRIANIGNATATVQVTIGGKPMKGSPFSIPAHRHKRVPDPDEDSTIYSGLVKVVSINNVPIVASKRVVLPQNPPLTSFSEMMGLPIGQLDTAYAFPWNGDGTRITRLQITNPTRSATTVNILIGGTKMAGSPFSLSPGQTITPGFAINRGPVVVRSTGAPIVASMRVFLPTSFSEMMGLPFNQLDTAYIFPWYDNSRGNTELRFAVP